MAQRYVVFAKTKSQLKVNVWKGGGRGGVGWGRRDKRFCVKIMFTVYKNTV